MPNIDDGLPLLEHITCTDFVTDGPARIEVLREDTVRIVYFAWRMVDGIWRRVVADYSRMCPISSLNWPLDNTRGVQIVARGKEHAGLHS